MIVDVFQSSANMPIMSDRLIRVVITGVKYTLNLFMNLDGIGSVLKFVTLPSPIIFHIGI